MPTPTLTENPTDRGPVFTYSTDSGPAIAHLPVLPELAELPEANRHFAATIARAFDRFQPAAATEELRRIAGPAMLGAIKRAIAAGQASRRAHAEADARAREIPPSLDMSQEAERRARYRGLSLADQMAAAQRADLADLAAIVARGNLCDWAPEAFDLASERYAALAWAERVGLASNHPRQPSLEGGLTVTGPDAAAVETAALAALAHHRQRADDLETVEAALRNQICLVAAALEMTPDDVLAATMAA
ncbi:hypothetical protein SAMN05518801_105245 [Novosphingobium sp. CF614]|nr:hypothetical protein SAMN05518801_105245 [Novosphingobium sp. CF614]